MRQRRWSREQVVLAWIVSIALHVAVIILLYGTTHVSRGRPGDRIDTRVEAGPELSDEVAFLIEEERPRQPQTRPAVAKEQPPMSVASAMEETVRAPAQQDSAGNASNPDKTGTAAPSSTGAALPMGRALHYPLHPGKSVVYVLDHSASMGVAGKLEQAVACIRLSLRESSPEVRFQIVAYCSDVEVLAGSGEDLVAATPANIAAAEASLKSLVPEGASSHLSGLRKGLSFQPDALFILTDADDLKADHLRAVGNMNRGRTHIYPVLFGAARNGADSPFHALAHQNGGQLQVMASQP